MYNKWNAHNSAEHNPMCLGIWIGFVLNHTPQQTPIVFNYKIINEQFVSRNIFL